MGKQAEDDAEQDEQFNLRLRTTQSEYREMSQNQENQF